MHYIFFLLGTHYFGVEIFLNEIVPNGLEPKVYLILRQYRSDGPSMQISSDLVTLCEVESKINQYNKELEIILNFLKVFYQKFDAWEKAQREAWRKRQELINFLQDNYENNSYE